MATSAPDLPPPWQPRNQGAGEALEWQILYLGGESVKRDIEAAFISGSALSDVGILGNARKPIQCIGRGRKDVKGLMKLEAAWRGKFSTNFQQQKFSLLHSRWAWEVTRNSTHGRQSVQY